ncbi:hypothetical protein GXN76_03065 [Kroppenstedtia pulmonis]|uniref:Uncharacterized protein n=1 Tax=Kroppenstedtia pulmonis TaxID=1380685 RepID=A0A7D4BEH0_9BACL|nr:hypothetical protein [Kroppenstedtia pulmonis]QKG83552.1 hypothetical protein GXN76_03065 [Kroppenstedtia pulmonis]
MKVEVNLSQEEFQVAKQCLERRYYELRRKILEGDRKGRSIQRYRQEAQLLERVIEEIKHGISGY